MYETLKSILVDDLKLTEVNITADATLKDAGVDSLALVELAMVLSKQHGIDISDDEFANVTTVGEVANLIEHHAAQA